MPKLVAINVAEGTFRSVSCNSRTIKAELADGRTISVPTAWFPRLANGTQKERSNWNLIGGGHGVTWPELDEDISVKCLLTGLPSGENPKSFARWLEKRAKFRSRL